MLGGIPWVLAVVLIWLLLFVSTLVFARYSAREHDQEVTEAAAPNLDEGSIPAEPAY